MSETAEGKAPLVQPPHTGGRRKTLQWDVLSQLDWRTIAARAPEPHDGRSKRTPSVDDLIFDLAPFVLVKYLPGGW